MSSIRGDQCGKTPKSSSKASKLGPTNSKEKCKCTKVCDSCAQSRKKVLSKVTDKNVNANHSSESSSGSEETSQTDSSSETGTEATLEEGTSTQTTSTRHSKGKKPVGRVASTTSKTGKPDYSKFTEFLSDSVVEFNSDYDYPKKLAKNYKLDLTSELQAKLDEVRVQYDVLKYKLYKSKTTCATLENENKRLRKQLEMHNEYEVKTSKALLKHTTDLNDIRAKYRDVKAELEKVKLGMKPMLSWKPKKQKSRAQSRKSVVTNVDSADDDISDKINQINNNRKNSSMLDRHKRKLQSSPRRHLDRLPPSKHSHGVSHHLNSNRRHHSNDPAVILEPPIIGKRRIRSYSRGQRPRARTVSARRGNRKSSAAIINNHLKSRSNVRKPHNKRTVVLTNVSRRAVRNRLRSTSLGHRTSHPPLNSHRSYSRYRSSRSRPQILRHRSSRSPRKSSRSMHQRRSANRPSPMYRRSPVKHRGVVARKARSAPVRSVRRSHHRDGGRFNWGNKTNNSLEASNDSTQAIEMLNSMLTGVHFDADKNLFYPGSVSEVKNNVGAESSPVPQQHHTLPDDKHSLPATALEKKTYSVKRKISGSNCNKQYLDMLRLQLSELDNKKRLNNNEKYIKDQYKKLLLSNARNRRSYPLFKSKLTSFSDKASPLNTNNNADESDDSLAANAPPTSHQENLAVSKETDHELIVGSCTNNNAVMLEAELDAPNINVSVT